MYREGLIENYVVKYSHELFADYSFAVVHELQNLPKVAAAARLRETLRWRIGHHSKVSNQHSPEIFGRLQGLIFEHLTCSIE
jgi:hypothetical protein